MLPVINLSVKFDANIFISDQYSSILLLRWFGWKMPIPAHFGEVFCRFDTLNVVGYCRDPQKAHPWPETRILAYRSSRSVKKCNLGARWKKAKKERKERKLRDVISHIFAQTTHVAVPHQSCHVRWGTERSQPCQASSKSFQGFWLPEGSKSAIFLCLALWLIHRVRKKKVPLYFCL